MLLAPGGPKGYAVARDVADGVVVIGRPPDERWDVCVQLAAGTVLEPGEDHTTPRMRGAVGPWYVVGAHSSWEWNRAALDVLPGGADWRDAVERARGEDARHLAVHEGHLVEVTERDQLVLDAAGPAILERGWTGTPDEVAARYVRAGESGATEVAYAPTGPDIGRELETFAAAVAGSR
jgi:5,10-methylenetetrahydromethanopterin reductase